MSSDQPKLTEDDLNIITFLDQYYSLHGELISAEKAEQDWGLPVVKYTKLLANKAAREALEQRGIVFQRFEKDDWTSKSLTPIQLLVVNSMLDLTDTRSDKKKLQDLGVATITYNAWLKDPVFKEYLHTRAEQIFEDSSHEAARALLDKVKSGDVKAIALYNEMTGRFVPQRANASNVDVQNVLVKVIEIIDIHVKDSDTKLAIANEFKRLIAARNIAAGLTSATDSDVIAIPEIMELPSAPTGTEPKP